MSPGDEEAPAAKVRKADTLSKFVKNALITVNSAVLVLVFVSTCAVAAWSAMNGVPPFPSGLRRVWAFVDFLQWGRYVLVVVLVIGLALPIGLGRALIILPAFLEVGLLAYAPHQWGAVGAALAGLCGVLLLVGTLGLLAAFSPRVLLAITALLLVPSTLACLLAGLEWYLRRDQLLEPSQQAWDMIPNSTRDTLEASLHCSGWLAAANSSVDAAPVPCIVPTLDRFGEPLRVGHALLQLLLLLATMVTVSSLGSLGLHVSVTWILLVILTFSVYVMGPKEVSDAAMVGDAVLASAATNGVSILLTLRQLFQFGRTSRTISTRLQFAFAVICSMVPTLALLSFLILLCSSQDWHGAGVMFSSFRSIYCKLAVYCIGDFWLGMSPPVLGMEHSPIANHRIALGVLAVVGVFGVDLNLLLFGGFVEGWQRYTTMETVLFRVAGAVITGFMLGFLHGLVDTIEEEQENATQIDAPPPSLMPVHGAVCFFLCLLIFTVVPHVIGDTPGDHLVCELYISLALLVYSIASFFVWCGVTDPPVCQSLLVAVTECDTSATVMITCSLMRDRDGLPDMAAPSQKKLIQGTTVKVLALEHIGEASVARTCCLCCRTEEHRNSVLAKVRVADTGTPQFAAEEGWVPVYAKYLLEDGRVDASGDDVVLAATPFTLANAGRSCFFAEPPSGSQYGAFSPRGSRRV